ncbi:hypothetical protein GJAV_G00142680 [Gymnothorax javanicus]|nr:hypothetical protein GJAV_G00142680 [Gymnothorax javanicus]
MDMRNAPSSPPEGQHIFALKFAEHLLNGTPVSFAVDSESAVAFRMMLATTLMHKSDDLSDLCHFCGEADNFDDATDIVWFFRLPVMPAQEFHACCAANPEPSHQYLCPVCLNI